eukprot:6046717-Amphidinium_carterae.3
MVRATMLPSTAVSKYSVAFVVSFLKSLFRDKVILSSDNEPAIKALAEAVKQQLLEQVVLQCSPRYSSRSMGVVERCIKDVQGLARVYRLQAQARYGVVLGHNHCAYGWLVRHAGWCMSRYFVKANKQTPYYMAYGVNYESEVVPL